jgi:hypothetical protein
MRIDQNKPLAPGAGHEIYRSQSVQPQQEVERADQEKSPGTTDRVEISVEAQRLLESQRPAELGGEAGQQNDAVASLTRNLVNAGVVDDSDRARKIAEKVMTKVEESHELNENRLQEIRQKLESNFYSSRQVAETVAERLQEEMNLR